MKIAFIASDNNASSGAFLSMANLAKQLNSFGVETILFLPSCGPYIGAEDGVTILDKMGLNYMFIPSITWIVIKEFKKTIFTSLGEIKNILYNKRCAKKLSRMLKKEHVDLVHINTSYSYFGVYAAKYANLPLVWHIREFLEEDQGMQIYYKHYGYRLFNRADLVIAISNSIYEKYKNIITKTQFKVIYNGIDPTSFYDSKRNIFSSEPLKLSYVGGLSPLKGINDLIEACKLLNDAGYEDCYNLTIAGRGDGIFDEILINNIATYNLSNVHYIGYQQNVAAVMKQADVSIVTSRYEAFGRVTVEAMLTGNLVLGADSAGTKELLQDGKLGLLYKCGDAKDLKDKIIYILEHKNNLLQTANAGREYMLNTMSAQKNAENIYKEYQKLLKDS